MEVICCEVCGSCSATAVMIPCGACPPGRRRAGCHTFCFPGPHSISSVPSAFTCLNCMDLGRPNRVPAAAAASGPQAAGCAEAAAAGTSAGLAMSAPGQVDHAAAAAAVELASTDVTAGPSTFDWSQLPIELLPAVLQHVDLQDRLCRYALVSTAWAAAARAATTSISISRQSAADLQDAWQACAAAVGSQLTHLDLSCQENDGHSHSQEPSILHLPCMHLRSLKVQDLTVPLLGAPARPWCASRSYPLYLRLERGECLPAPGTPGLLDLATGLTRLSLQAVTLWGYTGQQLAALTALTDLQDLSLSLRENTHAAYPAWLLPDSFMQQLGGLTKLTQLQLADAWLPLWSAAGMQHISCLTRLCSLSLFSKSGTPRVLSWAATVLQCLTALTSLELRERASGGKLPRLGFVSGLQQLALQVCPSARNPATVLAGVSGLRSLKVPVPVDASTLLPVLQRQTLLEHLQLEEAGPLHEAAVEAHSAVTASVHLQSLSMKNARLQPGVWGYMFPAGRLLQHLTSLEVCSSQDTQLSAGDLQLLVQACPVLQQLRLSFSCSNWPEDLQLGQVLAELTHLTQLCMPGVGDTHLQQLLQLTRLQDLELMPASSMTFEGVLVLTVMRQLTHLQFGLPSTVPLVHRRCLRRVNFQCDSKESLPVCLQLRQRWDAADAAWHRSEAGFSVLDEMGIPHEGYPAGHHGRSLRPRTNRAAKGQGRGSAS